MQIVTLDRMQATWNRQRICCIGAPLTLLLLLVLAIRFVHTEPPGDVWLTEGFESFRQGQFDGAGSNLYVSRRGVVQTIHRFDVNNDNYYDLPFSNTHDRTHREPVYLYRFGKTSPRQPELTPFPMNGSAVVRVADLNVDGLPDLLVGPSDANEGAVHNSWIYWGAKEGWSERRHMELVTPNVGDVCVGDLTGDSRPDLVFVAPGGTGYAWSRIYKSNRSIYSYSDFSLLRVEHAAGCLIGDFDIDGKDDLLLLTAGSGSRVYWGSRGGIDLEHPDAFPVVDGNSAVLVGSQVVVASAQGIKIYSSHRRHFSAIDTIDLTGPARMAAADVNHDGIPDVAVVYKNAKGLPVKESVVLLGRKSSSGVTFSISAAKHLPTKDATDVAIGDVDRDGFPDLVFANARDDESYNTTSYVYWGAATGFDADRRSNLKTHGAASVALNGQEVIFANSVDARRRGDVDSYIYLGSAEGQYSASRRIDLPTVGAYETCLADLNDDGFVDVAIVNSHEDAGVVGAVGSYIYWGGPQGLSPRNRTTLASRAGIGCAVADLDRDGQLDLLIANLADDTISLFFGNTNNFENAREQIIKARDARFPLIADLNKDGYLDLVVPSVKAGLYLFWGSASGYREDNQTILPGVGVVSEQIADLDRDGWLDIVANNLFDEPNRAYQGINSYVYWGSSSGYSSANRMDLPSQGGEHATIADFNRDGYLDVFISNYDSEFTRDLDSHIYWGGPDGLSYRNRTTLHVGSASGAASADLNGDGLIDLVVANHFENGSHRAESPIFWNSPQGFRQDRRTLLPTIGAHMMSGVDQGNLYDRKFREFYVSTIHEAPRPAQPTTVIWEGATPFDSSVEFELRGAESVAGIGKATWKSVGRFKEAKRSTTVSGLPARRFWQYRMTLHDGRACSPSVRRVAVAFNPS